jgi:hypothetical protein
MPSFKWMFRLAILLSFAWIAFGQSPSDRNGSGAAGPPTAIDAVLSKVTRQVTAFRDQAAQQIASELRNRGFAIGDNASPVSSATISEFKEKAASAIRDAQRQLTTNLGQNGDGNLQSMLTNLSQLDDPQIVSQLQSGVQRLIQQTGSPNPEQRLGADSE